MCSEVVVNDKPLADTNMNVLQVNHNQIKHVWKRASISWDVNNIFDITMR